MVLRKAFRGGKIVPLGPLSPGFIHVGWRAVLEVRRNDALDKVGGGSSRSQKGRGCKLHSTPNAQPTKLHRQSGLGPRRIIITEMDVGDVANDRLEHAVILFENW
jgi:hypothetical protein